MPQLQFMRDPGAGAIVLGTMMPPPGPSHRWAVSLAMQDHDGRSLGSAAWSLRRTAEEADIGLWMKVVYDTWFNSTPEAALMAGERAARNL